MKKYMIVPYEEPKIPTHEQKINSILKNKNINRENKLKLINHILINRNKKDIKDSDKENESNDDIYYETLRDNDSTFESKLFEQEKEEEKEQEIDLPPALSTRTQVTLDNTPWRKTPRQQRIMTKSKAPLKRKLAKETRVEEEPIKKLSRMETINNENKKQVLLKKAILTSPKSISRIKEKVKDTNEKVSKKQSKKSEQINDISMIDVGQEGRGWQKY